MKKRLNYHIIHAAFIYRAWIVCKGKVISMHLTVQKRVYRAPKGAHRSAVLVSLGNKSLIHESRHEQKILLVPYAQTYHIRAS